MALPTEPRSCACSFLKLFEWRRAARVMGGGSRNLEIFRFQVPQVGGRGQRFTRGLLDEFLYRPARADAVHVVAQPVHPAAELAGPNLLIEPAMRRAHFRLELAGA